MDKAYQITSERRNGPSATITYDTTYIYDPAMNRSVKIAAAARTTYAYNAGNQIRRYQDITGITTYSFDSAGNQAVERPPVGSRTTNIWDYENRLQSKRLGTSNQTMVYDPDHHRVQRTDATGSIVSIWDKENVIRETGPSTATKDYILQPETFGNLLSWRDGSTPYIISWDGQQSVRRTTSSTGVQNGFWLYDAWGVPSTSATQPPFGYIRRLEYASDGYVRRRHYQSVTSRFVSVDLILSKLGNQFVYCANLPITAFDPSGLILTMRSEWRFDNNLPDGIYGHTHFSASVLRRATFRYELKANKDCGPYWECTVREPTNFLLKTDIAIKPMGPLGFQMAVLVHEIGHLMIRSYAARLWHDTSYECPVSKAVVRECEFSSCRDRIRVFEKVRRKCFLMVAGANPRGDGNDNIDYFDFEARDYLLLVLGANPCTINGQSNDAWWHLRTLAEFRSRLLAMVKCPPMSSYPNDSEPCCNKECDTSGDSDRPFGYCATSPTSQCANNGSTLPRL